MSMIKAEHLSFTWPGSFDPVFEDVSFQLDTDWKLGLVGRNGRGKTTLLKLLMGEGEYQGSILSSVEFDYFPYCVPSTDDLTLDVLRRVAPQAQDWELERELSLLAVDEGAAGRSFRTLSNGERTKVLLAALFLNEGRFLLIDEPTNHLDAKARAQVAAYLRRKRGFILVSHDRRFLDGCVDHVLVLNRTTVEVRAGSFSAWLEDFQRQQCLEEAQSLRLQKDVKRLRESARRTSVWSDKVEASKIGAADKGFVGHKAAKLMKRAKSIEARQEKALEEKEALLKNRESAQSLKLSPLPYHARRLAAFDRAAADYGRGPVCSPVSFEICRGDRVALAGPNGCGKSSLLKLLAGQSVSHTGRVELGAGLVVSYVPQDTGPLTGSLTQLAADADIDESLFKTILRKMDFERVQLEKDLSALSEGQKKKVLLARSLCQQAHLYVWDEPLNFIDLYSRLQLEELILAFSPTMVFVEHDAAFRDNVATKTVELV